MIMDNKGRLFGKFSIVDLIIVVIIVGAVAGIGYKYTRSKTATPFTKLDDLKIVFYQEDAPEYAALAVKKGDLAKEAIQGSVFGSVSDIKIGDSIFWGADNAGKNVASPRKGYSSVYITMDGKGLYGTNGVTIDNAVYFVGKTIELRVGNSVFYGRIYSMEKK